MGSRKIIYRRKSTGELVIESGLDMTVTSSQAQIIKKYELLNQYGERTGNMVSVSPDDLEIVN